MTHNPQAQDHPMTVRALAKALRNAVFLHDVIELTPEEAELALDALEQPITAEEVMAIIARRLAKRQHGEHYEGYESSHREAAEDIAAALNRAKQQGQT